MTETTTKWPKTLRDLTPEEQAVHDDFMRRWHEVLPRRYGMVERFNHSFPVRYSQPGFRATIEIGAGLGEHLSHEHLSAEQERSYVAVELRDNMAERISEAHPRVQTIVGDCQTRLPFEDGSFDRYLAIHVLEHLPNLPACIAEAWRLLDKDRGQFLAVIPCEGGLRTPWHAEYRPRGSLNVHTACRMSDSFHASTSIARTRSSPSCQASSRLTRAAISRSRSCRQRR